MQEQVTETIHVQVAMNKFTESKKGDALHILIFTRYPVPGQAKTRLIPALGEKGAARLHKLMTEKTVKTARQAKAVFSKATITITICCTGSGLKNFRAWLGTDLNYRVQSSGDIGRRMNAGLEQAFDDGAGQALVLGSDLPHLTPNILCRAFKRLKKHDLVIGPADDGGYYLIGMKQPFPGLFRDVEWGTKRVLDRTRQLISDLGLNVAELPYLSDMDRPEDLEKIRQDSSYSDIFFKEKLSIIIPALNEESCIERTINHAQCGENVQIIVVDGGSTDATRKVAENAGAVVLTTSGGRAAQLNAGAEAATGRLLLFLHADTLLPAGYDDMIRNTLNDPATVAGAFAFRTYGRVRGMQLVEWMTNARSRIFQMPYGDQGLFLEKRVFNELGGFASMPIMEDFELVRRLRRRGRVATLDSPVLTSARRWQRLGIFRTTLVNQLMIIGFYTGVPMKRLKNFYSSKMAKIQPESRPKEKF